MNKDNVVLGWTPIMDDIPAIHTAGEPDGLIQKCARCGRVLQDYTNAQSVGDWQPAWWAGNVWVGPRSAGATEESANCEIKSEVQ